MYNDIEEVARRARFDQLSYRVNSLGEELSEEETQEYRALWQRYIGRHLS